MALATNSSVGDVHLNGDLSGSSDAYNPELSPTGVVPSEYVYPNFVVDQKGRILWAESNNVSEIVNSPASSSTKGICKFGTNITDETNGVFGVATASNTTLGVANSANTNHITITNGAIDIGTGVVTTADSTHITVTNNQVDMGSDVVLIDEATVFTTRQRLSISALGTSGNITPDLSVTDLFSINMSADGVLKLPSNLNVGDLFNVIVTTNGYNLTFDSEYKIRSQPPVPVGVSVVTCLVVSATKIYTLIQHNFI